MLHQKAVEMISVRKRVGGNDILRGLSLNVEKGDIYGLAGRNGAGKSTALRCLFGLTGYDAGEIRIFGSRIEKGRHGLLKRMGGIIDSPVFYPELTAMENLQYLSCAGRRAFPLRRVEIGDLLSTVGLGDSIDKRVSAFSLGMKQRLGLAWALAGNPELVILDEPVNGLDPVGIADLRRIIMDKNFGNGVTFVISSHIISELAAVCRTIGVIAGGRMIAEGSVNKLLQDYGSQGSSLGDVVVKLLEREERV